MNFSANIDLGQAAVSAGLLIVSWGLKQLTSTARHFIKRVDTHSELINEHSDVLEESGFVPRDRFRRVK